ncbi:MAG: (d)CMP kinase [Candidatus Omnitrophica bacterium]|nr:(d)CMP kinase [Candidatus Omnitrophota bacterium]
MIRQSVNVIAIDGPAGSGKSTVARGTAKALGYLYIDTGAMYRALTLKAVNNGIDLDDGQALEGLARETKIFLEPRGEGLSVKLDGRDVTNEIRSLPVTEKVKYVARQEGVRAEMVKLQRVLGEKSKGAVMEGRDIGTVVFPDARWKFYLDADFEVRVDRRYRELQEKHIPGTREEVSRDLEARDHTDKTRKAGPLKQAADAIVIDTTRMSIDEVIAAILTKKDALYVSRIG